MKNVQDSKSMDAIILGGGSVKGFEQTKQASKALIKIGKKPMVEYLVDILYKTPCVNEIVAILPDSAKKETWIKKVDKVLDAQDTIMENIKSGLLYVGKKNKELRKVMICSCDIPLLTIDAVEEFINRCNCLEADIVYPIIPKEIVKARFPETKRTYARMKDGTFTGGNIMVVSPEAILKNFNNVEKAYELRKSPLKLSQALGPKFMLKFMTRTLSIAEAEERCEELLKAKGRALVMPYPEVGFDVDNKEDLEYAERLMRMPDTELRDPN